MFCNDMMELNEPDGYFMYKHSKIVYSILYEQQNSIYEQGHSRTLNGTTGVTLCPVRLEEKKKLNSIRLIKPRIKQHMFMYKIIECYRQLTHLLVSEWNSC